MTLESESQVNLNDKEFMNYLWSNKSANYWSWKWLWSFTLYSYLQRKVDQSAWI